MIKNLIKILLFDYSLFYEEMNEGFDDCLSEDDDDGYDEEVLVKMKIMV